MIKRVFFDTDCISSFFKVGERNVIEDLFNARVVFPEEVYEELSHPGVPHLKKQADSMLAKGTASVEAINVGSNAFFIFRKLTSPYNRPVIGKGEGAAIALAYTEGGILASNNLRDVARYVEEYDLEHYTSLKILIMAEEQGLLTGLECESIWRAMKKNGIKLPEGNYEENKEREKK